MPLIVAVVNSAHESLEITRWVDVSEDELKRLKDEMLALVTRLYPRLTRTDTKNRQTMSAVGSADAMSNPDSLAKQEKAIHYALYEGRCLDPKGLSYFVPERTIEEGNLTLEEVRKILAS